MPLATAPSKNLPVENIERYLSRQKPTRVAVPIEEEENSTYPAAGYPDRQLSGSALPFR